MHSLYTISHVFGNVARMGQQICPKQLPSNEFGPRLQVRGEPLDLVGGGGSGHKH